jgi:hypothetical protein
LSINVRDHETSSDEEDSEYSAESKSEAKEAAVTPSDSGSDFDTNAPSKSPPPVKRRASLGA